MNCTRLNVPPRTSRERLHGQRLRQPRHALEQHVAACQQRDDEALEHPVLADDHALDLVEGLVEGGARLFAELGRLVVGNVHVFSFFVTFRSAGRASAATCDPADEQERSPPPAKADVS